MSEPAGVPLFVVADLFQVRGRGLVLWPGIAAEALQPRHRIRIARPDGSEVIVEAWPESFAGFSSVESAARYSAGPRPIWVDLQPDDVPVGSIVFEHHAALR